MNDRQRLEAIVAVVCKYLPPDGISREDALREIIELVDPLPEQEYKPWVGLTEEEIATIFFHFANKGVVELTRVIEANFKRKNGAT